jgi:hypothetical protein
MKKLPIGRQNFEGIINENLLYVDKTRQIYDIITNGNLYFLSRPRRFGKSLLVSIFKHIFLGNKHLFKDLYLGKETDYDFPTYPVLQFNFADYGLKTKNLKEVLSEELNNYATKFNVQVSQTSLSLQFKTLIQEISKKGKPVVLLIDEYDKPIVDFLTDFEKAKVNQGILRQLFGPLKNLEAQGHLRFLFITGVSKFSKVSLFSDLNNLTDLSLQHPFSNDLLGITPDELLAYFPEYITEVGKELELPEDELLTVIKNWYNGYSYDGKTPVYNPYSLLNFFQQQHFGNYWFETGTPTFLVEQIRNQGINPKDFEYKKVPATFFSKFSLEHLDMTGLLYQTGYLTIKKANRSPYQTTYILGYPNIEVRQAMLSNLVEAFTYQPNSIAGEAMLFMQDALEEGNVPFFVEQLKVILSDLKYNWQPPKPYKTEAELFKMWEGYFHAVIYLIMAYLNLYVQAEVAHHKGRLDLLAQTDDFLYLMEFKLEETAENAIAQIKEREYAAAYKNSSKKVFLVGISFSKEERNVDDWEMEVWE